VHVVLSIALHAITLYLVVLMAYIRYCAMRVACSIWLRSDRSILAAIGIAVCVFVLCIPTLLAHEIIARRASSPRGLVTQYSIGFSEMVLENGCFLMKGNLWLTGIFLKAIPCVLLFWFTIALIGRMKENKEKRKKLLKSRDDKGKRDVTTYMLVFMVTVFLVTELPQGVMAVLNALYTSQFHAYVYLALADVLDLLSLINCYVAFLVYICTCSRYRQTLLSILPNMPSNISRHSSVKREKLPYATIGANDTATETSCTLYFMEENDKRSNEELKKSRVHAESGNRNRKCCANPWSQLKYHTEETIYQMDDSKAPMTCDTDKEEGRTIGRWFRGKNKI
ncbi:hypothetical protein TELCIR_15864, partial [Teladorsagia circumcincta]